MKKKKSLDGYFFGFFFWYDSFGGMSQSWNWWKSKLFTLCFEKANNQHILTIHLLQRIFIYLFILKKFVLLQMIFFWKAATSTNPRYGLGGHSKFLNFFESTFNFEDQKIFFFWTQQFQIFSTNLCNIFMVLPLTMDD